MDIASGEDPCFATYACTCNNGYKRIAANMPPLTTQIEVPVAPEPIDEDIKEKVSEGL